MAKGFFPLSAILAGTATFVTRAQLRATSSARFDGSGTFNAVAAQRMTMRATFAGSGAMLANLTVQSPFGVRQGNFFLVF
jgi:hypothetical protein